jgi:hypothetical protein
MDYTTTCNNYRIIRVGTKSMSPFVNLPEQK